MPRAGSSGSLFRIVIALSRSQDAYGDASDVPQSLVDGTSKIDRFRLKGTVEMSEALLSLRYVERLVDLRSDLFSHKCCSSFRLERRQSFSVS
jgi:hypothetical protein